MSYTLLAAFIIPSNMSTCSQSPFCSYTFGVHNVVHKLSNCIMLSDGSPLVVTQ